MMANKTPSIYSFDYIDDLYTHLRILESCLSDYLNKERETNNE